MSGVLANVDQRTQLVGENRLELLMFKLFGSQLFAINVFKVQEVLQLPRMTMLPKSNHHICGVVHLRGVTLPVINLSQAIGMPALEANENSTIIVTEYNTNVQAFLVAGVERIVNMNWEEIRPPPKGTGRTHYLTALTHFEDKIVEIIDVEKVLSEITPFDSTVSSDIIEASDTSHASDKIIVVVDDSPVAMGQNIKILDSLNLRSMSFPNGLEAWKTLKQWADTDAPELNNLLMVLTDAEMPEMDGYRLTTEIRANEKLKDTHVVLHTSLSGSFNQAMVEKVGCDAFLSKFQPDKLAATVLERVESIKGI